MTKNKITKKHITNTPQYNWSIFAGNARRSPGGHDVVAEMADGHHLDILLCNEIASKRQNLSGVL